MSSALVGTRPNKASYRYIGQLSSLNLIIIYTIRPFQGIYITTEPDLNPAAARRAVNNKSQTLQDLLKEHETTIEDNWKGIKIILSSTCLEVLSSRKHYHKKYISIETIGKIQEWENKTEINNSRTREEKVMAQADYAEANKQMKRIIRADKLKNVEDLPVTVEKHARKRNMKRLYDTTKKLAGKYNKPDRPVKDKESRPITEIQEQKKR
ncbi:unnamed protein product [Schistosoma margrebowiei]|uniref:Uncharacterized protein n=1 Tax=Schistosoma margrebowiei TaxID=48269 RepID=A0A183LNN2_9TREM|nr:unnamed protein product [Schistosoma margrebowiei]